MVNKVHSLLAGLEPALARPSKRLVRILSKVEAALEGEEPLAACAGHLGHSGEVGVVVVVTGTRVFAQTPGRMAWDLRLADVTALHSDGQHLTFTSDGKDYRCRTPQAAALVDAAGSQSVETYGNTEVDRQLAPHPKLTDPLRFRVGSCTVLGGSGPWPLAVGDPVTLVFQNGTLAVTGSRGTAVPAVSYADLRALDLDGRGEVTEGGGFIGGGFGIEGIIGGMALAGVLNALTTSSSVETLIRVEAADGELFVAHTHWTPLQLRLMLSEAFMGMRPSSGVPSRRSPGSGQAFESVELDAET